LNVAISRLLEKNYEFLSILMSTKKHIAMKKLLLLSVSIFAAATLSAQYGGVPWNGAGNPWVFQADSFANFHVGNDLEWKNDYYLGVPHYAYDIGEVDTMLLPSESFTLVAGSGDPEAGQSPSSSYRTDYGRYLAATNDANVTLTVSDTMSQWSPNYGGYFTVHNNSAVMNGTGGWYRYTCNFADAGNYKIVIRGWGADKSGHGFWIRFYDLATMDPIYPWTRMHPGQGGNVTVDQENAVYIDMNDTLYVNNMYSKSPNGASWIESTDEFSLSGDVVFEYTNIGPTPDYDKDVTGSGRSFWGEFTFMYQGAEEDKFAPVAEPYKSYYDDMEVFEFSLSEDGTMYMVPAGTAIEDAEANNIDKMVMTTSDTYSLDLTTLELPDTVQIVTTDAAGNSRITAPIRMVDALSVDKTQANNGDTLFVNTRRSGFVALVPSDVAADYTNLIIAISQGNADTINVGTGNDTLVISNLSGDMDCNLFLYDEANAQVSYAIPIQLGEGGGGSSVLTESMRNFTIAAFENEITVRNISDFSYVSVYDILGKQHIRQPVSSNTMHLDASGLHGGVYILKMSGNNGVVTRKFLLSK
jgi:hypothetical protein